LVAFSSTGFSLRIFMGCKNANRQPEVCATVCATRPWQPAKPPNGCAIIYFSFGHRGESHIVFCEARHCKPMTAADRSTHFLRTGLLLFALIGIPRAVRSATLDDSAKELGQKIAAVLPAGENVSCEIHNLSSLKPDEASRIGQALKAELEERGIHLSSSGATTAVMVTLSENFKNLIWTGEIHQADASQVVLIAVQRLPENSAFTSAMPVMIHTEKFWEGPERILDAGEITDGNGKSWLVLLLPDGLLIQDKQTGTVSTLGITSNQSATHDPWGNLNFDHIGNSVAFFLSPRICNINLESPNLDGCLPAEGSNQAPPPSPFPVMFDIAPAGPPPAGKGTVIEMKSVCGNTGQFLATSARDYTQTDSLQVFQVEANGAVAVSGELDFPGPITALHAVSVTPRAVVRNLTTGNYEAYNLSFSCGQ
jgi:hypothetical protein